MRLDKYLAFRGLTDSRSKAELLVQMGNVTVDNKTVTKPSFEVNDTMSVKIINALKYASQGGYKLELAITKFGIDCLDKVCIDIGASSGGFTDCLLTHGARRVYAVDVGDCALPKKLLDDSRLIPINRINARYIELSDVGERADIITIDVSFVSVKLILPAMLNLLKDDGLIVCLIKPQFEAGKDNVGSGGIIRDKALRNQIVNDIEEFAYSLGLSLKGLVEYEPIDISKNIEYLSLFKLNYI